MLVVDSSVWIDFFNGADAPAAELLSQLLDHGEVRLVVPDLVLFEVLRGFREERAMRQARLLLQTVGVEACGGEAVALAAAEADEEITPPRLDRLGRRQELLIQRLHVRGIARRERRRGPLRGQGR